VVKDKLLSEGDTMLTSQIEKQIKALHATIQVERQQWQQQSECNVSVLTAALL